MKIIRNKKYLLIPPQRGRDLSFTKSFAASDDDGSTQIEKKTGNTRRNVETMGQTSLFNEFTVFSFIVFYHFTLLFKIEVNYIIYGGEYNRTYN